MDGPSRCCGLSSCSFNWAPLTHSWNFALLLAATIATPLSIYLNGCNRVSWPPTLLLASFPKRLFFNFLQLPLLYKRKCVNLLRVVAFSTLATSCETSSLSKQNKKKGREGEWVNEWMNEGCCFAGNFVGTSLMPMLLKLDDLFHPKVKNGEEIWCGETNGVRRE